MGKYDGPSFLKQQQASKQATQSKQSELLPKYNRTKSATDTTELQVNQKKQLNHSSSSSNKPIFRATEVPSPIFGYNKKQRERMGKADVTEKYELEWNYQRLQSHMMQKIKNKEFIMTEECLSPCIISRWKKYEPSIEQSSRPKKDHSATSKSSAHQSKQRSSGSRKKKH